MATKGTENRLGDAAGRAWSATPATIPRRHRALADRRARCKPVADYQRELRATIPPGGIRAMYLDHLHALAEETRAVLSFYHPRGFVSSWAGETRRLPGCPPEIQTPLPLTRAHYLTGLHEFGHVHQPELGGSGAINGYRAGFGNLDDACLGVYGELMAYVWAFEHSQVPVTRSDIDNARGCVLACAKDAGWQGGPVADFMPEHLRQQYSEGEARLERCSTAGGA